MTTRDHVAAELAIRNVLARLAQLADTGDVDSYVALLTDDVAWTMPANPTAGLPASARHGHAEIAAGQRERLAAGLQGPGSHTMHVVTTTSIIVGDDDTATAHSYFQYWVDTSTQPSVRNVGRYRDELRRTPDGWKLAARTITFG